MKLNTHLEYFSMRRDLLQKRERFGENAAINRFFLCATVAMVIFVAWKLMKKLTLIIC